MPSFVETINGSKSWLLRLQPATVIASITVSNNNVKILKLLVFGVVSFLSIFIRCTYFVPAALERKIEKHSVITRTEQINGIRE